MSVFGVIKCNHTRIPFWNILRLALSMERTTKRRRVNRSPSPAYKLDDEDTYEPYVSVAERRQARLAKLSNRGANAGQQQPLQDPQDQRDKRRDEDSDEEVLRERARKDRTLLVEAQEVHSKKAAEGTCRSLRAHGRLLVFVRCTED